MYNDDDYDYTPDDPDEVTCNKCGTTGLTWFQSPVTLKWRLIDDRGFHSCKNKTEFPTLED